MSTNSTAMRGPRRDATENRAALIDSARALLNRDPDASLEAIAAGAGLSRRAVYGHFATRDDLVGEMQSIGSERIVRALSSIDHDDARVAIALIGARLWSEVESVRVTAQLAIRGPQRDRVGVALEPVRQKLLAIVERGASTGRLRSDIAPATLARLIEGAALTVLDEAVRTDLSRAQGHRLVMLTALSVGGLSWGEADEVIRSHPELGLDAGATVAHDTPAAHTPLAGAASGAASAAPAAPAAPASSDLPRTPSTDESAS